MMMSAPSIVRSLLLALAVSGAVCDQNLQQTFIREPKSVTVTEGDSVTLECGVRNKVGVLQWTKDDFGLGTSRSLPGYSRLTMVGGDSDTWNLQIENVTLEDDGRYQCQVGATETVGPIRSEYATLSILSPPEPPVLTVGPVMRVEEAGVGLVQCISRGGHPASMIRWKLNGQLVSSGIQENVTRMKNSKKMITISTLKFPVTINLSGSELSCEAEHKAISDSGIVKTRIQVEYKPKVTLHVNKAEYSEGESLTVSCNVDALPEQVSYQWFVGGEEIPEAAGAVEMVIDLTRDLHDKTVSCLARNSLGQTSADYKLDVKYGPRFVGDDEDSSRSVVLSGKAGDRIILQCQVDSNPTPQYSWMKNGDAFEIVGTGSVLSFSLTPATEGSYTCQASSPGYTPLTKQTQVTLLGPPVILERDVAQYGTVGDTVQVHCETQSSPDIQTFVWRFNGEEVDKQSPVLSIVQSRSGNKVKSTIVIKNAQRHHFGEYYCAVENELGQAEAVIKLKELEPLPLLIILAATISGVLLSIVALVLAVTCRKLASKNDPEADISAWPRQPHHGYSESSSDEPSQSNITSSLTVDDPDDSFESLPVNYSAFIKSENIPDLKTVYQESSNPAINAQENTIFVREGMRRSCNYIVYNHYTSDQELLHQSHSYSNPYVQSTSPMTVSTEKSSSPVYTNITPYKDTAVIRYLEGEVTASELDNMKLGLGTHV